MLRETVFIILTAVFGFLAFVTTDVLIVVHFTKGQRKRWLTMLDGKQLHLAIAALIFGALAYGSNKGKDLLNNALMMISVSRPYREFTQKATLTEFEKELAEAATERASGARDYFKAAEHDFEARRYRDSAENYQKPIRALPTGSAYLNLVASLLYLSDFRQAEGAGDTGEGRVHGRTIHDGGRRSQGEVR
jgi:hypothetical protein